MWTVTTICNNFMYIAWTHEVAMIISCGTNIWWHRILMNGVINDFDKENFDEYCFLPVKRTIMLFLLLLHLLVAVISMYLCDDIFLFHFVECCACVWLIGYHVYQDNWEPDIGDLYNIILYCERTWHSGFIIQDWLFSTL